MAVPQICMLALWLTAVTAESDDVARHLFPDETESVYWFRGDVSTGTTVPASFLSHFALQGTLLVQKKGQRAVFKLNDVTSSTYNGRGTRQKLPAGEFSWLPVPEEASAINTPFAATFVDGKVTGLEVARSEPLWSSNLKRAVAAQFQLDLTHIGRATPRSFVSSETGVSGECSVENLVLEGGRPDHLRLRKSINAKGCKEPTFWTENLSPRACSRNPQNVVSSSTERTYSLVRKSGDLISIQKVRSRGLVTLQPFGEHGELHYHLTNQTLELRTERPINDVITMPEDSLVTSLTFVLPKVNPETNADPDLTFGRQQQDSEARVNYTLRVLEEIARDLDESVEEATSDPAGLHEVKLFRIFPLLRAVDEKGLRQLADQLLLGTSYLEETVRSLFLEVLPRVGTRAALLVVRDLIMENKITSMVAHKTLMMLPFNVRHPDQQLLADLQVLRDLDKDNQNWQIATLSFASLVGKVCGKVACEPAVLDDHVKFFFSKLRDSTDYGDQMLYLQAMGNIQMGPVSEYLEPIITGKLEYPHHLRVLASWATMGLMAPQPDKVSKIYWPLLGDRRQHLELRVAALAMLMMSKPTPERFMSLLWFMVGERNSQLYSFFYTSVQSLVDTKHPCYMAMSPAAAQIFRLMPSLPKEYNTRNHILDLEDPGLNSGEMAQYLMVADETSGLPNVFYVQGHQHALGYTSSTFGLYLKIEGVSHAVTSNKVPDAEGMQTLLAMLSSLKVAPRSPKPIHIEIILQVFGRTVSSHYFNQSSIANIAKVVEALKSVPRNYHSNLQALEQLLMESVRPSDLGSPIILELHANMLLSMRGNVSNEVMGATLFNNFTLDTRALMQESLGIRTYNFLTGHWQGVHKLQVRNLVVPLRGSLMMDFSTSSLKIRQDWTPGQPILSSTMHTKTQTYVFGRGARALLNQSCPECAIWAVVSHDPPRNVSLISSTKERGLGVQLELFDCEKRHPLENKMELLEAIFSEKGKNFRSFPEEQFSLGLMQAERILEFAPLVGSCGVKFAIVPRGEASSIEWVIRGEKGGNEKVLVRSLVTLRSPSEVALKTWDTNVIVEMGTERSFALKLRVTRQAKGEKTSMMCMKVESRYPDVPDSWDALTSTSPGHIAISMFLQAGESLDGKCPSDGFKLTVSGTSNDLLPLPLSGPMQRCVEDKGSKKRFPATATCAMAVKSVSQPSTMSFNITHSALPEAVQKSKSRLTAVFHTFLPEVVPASLPDTFTLDLARAGDAEVKVRVSTDQGSGQYSPAVTSYVMEGIDNVVNVKAWKSPSAAVAMEVASECVVAGDRLLTFENTSIAFSPSPRFTLVAADCTDKPEFAVFVKSVEGTDVMAVKAFFPGEVIDIDPLALENRVKVNGLPPSSNKTEGFVLVEVSVTPGKVSLHSDLVDVWVRHSAAHVTVTMQRYSLAGLMCGLCGDGNEGADIEHFLGPDGEIVTAEELPRVYTVPAA